MNFDSIVDNSLHIVNNGDKDDPYYYVTRTIELTELAQELSKHANISIFYLNSLIYSIFCWAFRNKERLMTSQSMGMLFFENVIMKT